MKPWIPLIALALSPILTAQARLGETFPQLETRYGPAVSQDAATRIATFEKNGITIRVHLGPNATADWLTYQRNTAELSPEERRALLQANQAGSEPWREVTKPVVSRSALGQATVHPPSRLDYQTTGRWAAYLVKERYLAIALDGITAQPPNPTPQLDGF